MATKQTTKKKTVTPAAAKSAVVKNIPLKAAPKKKVVANVVNETPVDTKVVATKKPLKVKKSYAVLIVAILVLGAALYFLRGLFVAAVVNGQPVSRLEIVAQAEKQSGKQVMTTLVRNALIEQEAKRQNVSVSDKEVTDEIKKLEGTLAKQGQKLDQVLTVQGMSRGDLTKLIRLDKLVAKMVGKDVTVSDKEVNEYVEKNKELLPKEQKEDELKKTVKEQLKQQKTNEKVKTWLENLQSKAKVIYFVQY